MIVEHNGHKMKLTETGEVSSGRPRIKVACLSCNIIVHEGTTGPDIRIRQHLDGPRLSACVLVQRYDSLVLVVTNRRHGGFSIPGGKLEGDEGFEDCAARELREETGIEVDINDLRMFGFFTHLDPQGVRWKCATYSVPRYKDCKPKIMEAGTVPLWTTMQDLLERGLYQDWCRWVERKWKGEAL